MDEKLEAELRVRISESDLDKFKRKSESTMGKPYQFLIREMVTAFNQGRLQIKSKTKGEIYVN